MDFATLPNENSKRFIAILNKKIPLGKLLNALGHMTAGLAGGNSRLIDMCLLQYQDQDDGLHPNISHYPFIVLKADNSNQIRNLRNEALRRHLPFTDFTHTMTVGTSEAQVTLTRETSEADLEYYGICLFGNTHELKEFTQKFSLFN